MTIRSLCMAAVVVGLSAATALSQDVTLTARDGSLSVDGTMQGFDGEFYRVATNYGVLTLDGQGVICDGPGCPDLTAPFASIRMTGAKDAATVLLLPLWAAFAKERGLNLTVESDGPDGFVLSLADPLNDKPIARVSFSPADPNAARLALEERQADLVLTFRAEDGSAERVVALDALVPIVAVDNLLPDISTTDLARALTGGIANWAELGGPDMPLALHSLAAETSLEEALEGRLGNPVAASIIHPDQASLAAAVARDPYALAITALSTVGDARRLPLTDSCGFPLEPTRLALKAEDYPLALPVFLQTPKRRLPLIAREFLEFLSDPAAQAAITGSGFVDRAAESWPLTADGLRLINAIQGAGEDTTLADLQRLADVMGGADRLSLTFRFEDGSATLDAQSQENLADVARLYAIGEFKGLDLVLAGFSDGSGPASENLALSRTRAETVAAALALAAPDISSDQTLPKVEAFGEAMPMACDTTSGGRRLNRRVELWLRPSAEGDSTATAEP
jgi:phosphate transport system substrate-binding protein